ncbi:acyltransferase [Clostridium sp. YIM B02551]|uniref:acyltransferase family protein n=1 Tax=Clostridium sp. YIM B02551 TaxID=2910679 RepID=UPI001EEBC27D|nr:acyltransferase [Clostridium sp. YIM B02551]
MIQYSVISKYRNKLMGIAILWVMLFHAKISYTNNVISFIKKIGYGGVDIFIFLSGFGLYLSLEKNRENVLNFYERRIKRILPYYMPFISTWIIYKKFFNGGISIREALGNIFMFGYWINLQNQFNWYVQDIFLFYLISPILYLIISKSKKSYKSMFKMVIVFFISCICFFGNFNLIAISRLPIFVIGMYFAHNYTKGKQISLNKSIISLTLNIIGLISLYYFITYKADYLWKYGLWWYPFVFITPILIFILSFIFGILEKLKMKFILKCFEAIGVCSFELYMIHIFFYEIFDNYKVVHNLGFILLIIVIFIASISYHFFISYILKLIKKNYRSFG